MPPRELMSTVLVHGGAHGAWCWEPLLPYLEGDALAIDLPPKSVRGGSGRLDSLPELRTLTIDDFARSLLDDVDDAGIDRFVLVGHSMGGLTISEVARRVPDLVEHLVYVSCMVPPEGGSAIEALPEDLQDMTRQAVEEARRGGANPIGGLDEATTRSMFCNDMGEDQSRFVLDRTGTEAAVVLAEPVTRRGIPPELPKTFVKLLQDQSLVPDRQDVLIDNLRACPGGDLDVVTIDAGHDVMISRPKELAVVLNRIAGTVG
ncbi:MAG TPA: alpha/beta fold hydrolase [Acidimicrobiia bacterium]|nr:alpha/beta fold hydrolase [Acidimicrobiia bacterium]